MGPNKTPLAARLQTIGLWCAFTAVVTLLAVDRIPAYLEKRRQAKAVEAKQAEAATAAFQRNRQAQLNRPIKPRVLQIGESQTQMVVVRVPIVGTLGDIEHIRCLIWRDAELSTSTMSCLNEPESSLFGDRE